MQHTLENTDKKQTVAIIILNWNGKEDTLECLESLKHITYPNYEILLVDNGSTDGSVECFRERYPGMEIIENGANLGFAEGNNVGIRRAIDEGADYVLLLNNDTVVDPEFLDKMLNQFNNTNGNVGVVGAILYYYDKTNIIQMIGGKVNMWNGRREFIGCNEQCNKQKLSDTKLDFVSGAAMLIDSNIFAKIGLLDVDYITYTEDVDFCYRAKKAGYSILASLDAKVWHKVSASSGGIMSPTSLYYIYRNNIIFMKKHAKIYHFPSYMVLSLFYFAKRLLSVDAAQSKKMFEGIQSAFKFFIRNQ